MNPALNASSVLQCFKHVNNVRFLPGTATFRSSNSSTSHNHHSIPFDEPCDNVTSVQSASVHTLNPLLSRSTWTFPCISIGNKAHLFWRNLWIFMLVQCPHLVYTSQGLWLISGHSPVSETPVPMYAFITHHHKYQNLEPERPGSKARAEWLMSKSQRLLLNSPGLERFPVTSPYEIFIIHCTPY